MQLVCVVCLCALLALVCGQQCRMTRRCAECVRMGCRWCADPALGENFAYRCYAPEDTHLNCPGKHVYPEKSALPFLIVKDKSFSIDVLFRPQSIKLNLTVGEEFEFAVKYKHARNYPMDLYYLMDLSASMKDDKSSLSALGSKLAIEMKTITPNFKLGFGSFVDKVEMPFVSTVEEFPCPGCAAAYGFKNHLKLNNNTDMFAREVNNAQISGNMDTPEGGLDALMQSIVCPEQIGWRKNARHLLVFSTDADFHMAGDGRLAGLVEPNDMQCWVNDKGVYTKSTEFDYPSISQINKVAKEHNINIIFAVTKKVIDIYKRLAGQIEGASYGLLDGKSSNVVDLIREEYKKILDSLTLTHTANSEYLNISLMSDCGGGGRREVRTCGNLRQGDEVLFWAKIKVLKCPPDRRMKFQLKPTALEDHVDVELSVACDCSCEKSDSQSYERGSEKCTSNGDLKCGVCECYSDWTGDKCQCKKNSLTYVNENNSTDTCRASPDSPTCSGAGICKCGVCDCSKRENPSERYSGQFCECNNWTCERHNGAQCSGADHGECVCGKCECKQGWTGDACECALDVRACIQPLTNLLCSGKGRCHCGSCKCNVVDGVQYRGKYCQDCETCKSVQCAIYSDLVQCHVFQTGILKDNCTQVNFTIIKVERVEEPDEVDNNIRVCRILDEEDGCFFSFLYKIDDESEVIVQQTKECAQQINILVLVLGVVGGIVLIGLLSLIVWKIATTIHDSREYARFEEESKKAQTAGNPLYREPVIKYHNPTFKN